MEALYNNISGGYNTAVGDWALRANKTGSYITALGEQSNVTVDGLRNATVIGSKATVDASNKVRIGNTSVTSIGGQVGWTVFSDGRYKRNIREDVQGLSFINSLRPITYTVDVQSLNAYYNKGGQHPVGERRKTVDEEAEAFMKESEQKGGKIVYSGFVAQEVEETAKKLKYEFSGVDKPQTEGGLYGLRYSDFVVPLVKAVQELDAKTKEIDELKARIERLEALLTRNNNATSVNLSSAYLEQNIPNPARGTTTIRYKVPEGTASTRLTLTNAKGQLIKTFSLNNRGAGQLNLDTSTLSAGVYNYSLLIAGTVADTKQLVITR
jgi:hypothetical protein